MSAYRNETNSLVKSQMSDLISTIKESFSTNISRDSKEQKQLRKLGAELYNKFIGKQIFDENLTEKQQEEREKEQEKLEQKIAELEASIEATKNSKLYDKAFEWRFEFPEVLHDDGSFIGFDIK